MVYVHDHVAAARNLDWDIYDMLQLVLSAPINSWYVSQCWTRENTIYPKGPFIHYVSTLLDFLEPAIHYPTMSACIKTVSNVSKNDHFLNPPTQTICWRNIRMVPELSRELEREEKNLGQDQSSFFFFRVWYVKDTYQRNIRIYWVRISQPFTFFYQSVEKASFFMISQTIDIELGLKNKRVADKGQKISVAIFLGFNSSKKPTTNCHKFFPCL